MRIILTLFCICFLAGPLSASEDIQTWFITKTGEVENVRLA